MSVDGNVPLLAEFLEGSDVIEMAVRKNDGAGVGSEVLLCPAPNLTCGVRKSGVDQSPRVGSADREQITIMMRRPFTSGAT